MHTKFKEALTYDDLLLVPRYSDIRSRSHVDTAVAMDANITLSLPIISSPMDTVTETSMATAMHQAGGLGVIHRYNSIEEQAALVHDAHLKGITNIGAAIGVTGDFEERAQALCASGANVICVDVAHGHHILMKTALESLRLLFDNNIHIIAGNVATLEGFNDLADWGANSVRCNIGGGSICSTRTQTGHGVPGLQTIMDCAVSDRNANIIADGGVRTSGDIVKAIAAGADFVMLGSLLSGTEETPGKVQTTATGKKYKLYQGMASRKAQESWKGTFSSDEGISTFVDYKGPVQNVLTSLHKGLVSGLSYSGCRNISEFQSTAKFIKQTQAGLLESHTHILKK
jgi:IMP dehydrogenase